MTERFVKMDMDYYGRYVPRVDVSDMMFPVQCSHCQGVYCVGKVEVTARYSDCSVWKSPCCGLTVDDRGAGWKSRPDYVELDREGRPKRNR